MSGITVALPDGSVATVESIEHNASLVSRAVDGRTVWGQAFSCGAAGGLNAAEAHERQVRSVLDDMAERPEDFFRWWNA